MGSSLEGCETTDPAVTIYHLMVCNKVGLMKNNFIMMSWSRHDDLMVYEYLVTLHLTEQSVFFDVIHCMSMT